MNPRAALATRRTGVTVGAVTFDGERTAVHIIYVESTAEAHREFLWWCDRNGMTLAEPVRDEHGEPVLHAHRTHNREHGQLRVKPDGTPCAKGLPVAYRVAGPVPIDGVDSITFSGGRRRAVYARHPELVVTPFGRGSGQGELSEGAARRMRAQDREGRYRAAERARGTLRANATAPAMPDATHGYPLAELSEELRAELLTKGRRITKIRPCYGEPGFAWVTIEERNELPEDGSIPPGWKPVRSVRKKVELSPDVPVAPPAVTSAERRAEELARLSPPATAEELARAFPAREPEPESPVFWREPAGSEHPERDGMAVLTRDGWVKLED